jgi:hypothetical protein
MPLSVEQVGAACHTGDHTCFDADDLAPVTGTRRDRPRAIDQRARDRRRRRDRDHSSASVLLAGCSRSTALSAGRSATSSALGVVIGGAVLIAAARRAPDGRRGRRRDGGAFGADAVADLVGAHGSGRRRCGGGASDPPRRRFRARDGAPVALGRPSLPARARARGLGSRPHDAIDAWDDLSHGDDPTAR